MVVSRLLLFSVTVAEILIFRAMADGSEAVAVQRVGTGFSSNGVVGRVADGRSLAESPEEGGGGGEGGDRTAAAEAPGIRRLGKHKSSPDKAVAGGGVILGGLVTAVLASVFCYIRVTRRRDGGGGAS